MVPRLLPGTGPRRCPCSRPCVRRPHRNLTRISAFWRPFSDAATEREPFPCEQGSQRGAPRRQNRLSAPQGGFR